MHEAMIQKGFWKPSPVTKRCSASRLLANLLQCCGFLDAPSDSFPLPSPFYGRTSIFAHNENFPSSSELPTCFAVTVPAHVNWCRVVAMFA